MTERDIQDRNDLSGECSNAEFRAWLKSSGWDDEGWIDERGNFWPADEHMKHGYIAAIVLDMTDKDAEKEADRRGWLRISDYGIRTASKRLNQKQQNTLFDYCQHFKCDYQEVFNQIQFLS